MRLVDTPIASLHTHPMTLADKFTTSRLIMAPVFFILYLLPGFAPSVAPALWTVPVLWILFVASEITDMLDGKMARKRGEVSDFGKLYDPFADTLTQITFFLCFIIDGILPSFLFLLVIYREFSILFVRNLLLKRGITLGARILGKIKTVTYIVAAGVALLAASLLRLGLNEEFYRWTVIAAQVIFAVSVLFSVASFVEYFSFFLKNSDKK